MIKNKLLKTSLIPITVEVDGEKIKMFVKRPSFSEVQDMAMQNRKDETEEGKIKTNKNILASSLVDENGERFLNSKDIDNLGFDVYLSLFEKVNDIIFPKKKAK